MVRLYYDSSLALSHGSCDSLRAIIAKAIIAIDSRNVNEALVGPIPGFLAVFFL